MKSLTRVTGTLEARLLGAVTLVLMWVGSVVCSKCPGGMSVVSSVNGEKSVYVITWPNALTASQRLKSSDCEDEASGAGTTYWNMQQDYKRHMYIPLAIYTHS